MVDFLNFYKLVFLRGAIYTFIPAATLFLTQTETWGEKDWDLTGPFLRGRLLLACLVAGITALASFVDNSAHRAKESLESKHRGDTETMRLQEKLK